jgi:glycosyltransferase 2 family protein
MEEEKQDSGQILKSLSPNHVIIPIIIGLGITIWLLYSDLSSQQDVLSQLKSPNYLWIAGAFLALLIRDGFYIYRIRELTHKALSWTGSFYTIILWEFSSAISPSAVGGTAVASFLLLKEGISFGKSLAYVLVSAILDNSFFILMGALVLIFNGLHLYPNGIFYLHGVSIEVMETLRFTFYVSYTVITLYTLLMVYGLFVKPEFIKWLFIKLTSFAFLKRFQKAAIHQGDELVIASANLKEIQLVYWFKAIVSTLIVWTARYFIVNCLIAAFFPLTFGEHTVIFSRHVVLWVVLIIAITPGGSGIAELAFKGFYTPYTGIMVTIIATLWRMITYYPYLIAGVVALPRWLKRVFFEANVTDSTSKGIILEKK